MSNYFSIWNTLKKGFPTDISLATFVLTLVTFRNCTVYSSPSPRFFVRDRPFFPSKVSCPPPPLNHSTLRDSQQRGGKGGVGKLCPRVWAGEKRESFRSGKKSGRNFETFSCLAKLAFPTVFFLFLNCGYWVFLDYKPVFLDLSLSQTCNCKQCSRTLKIDLESTFRPGFRTRPAKCKVMFRQTRERNFYFPPA